jgi:hypothetical protein
MLRSTRDAAKVGVIGFGVGVTQWLAIERAVADARERAQRAGITGCVVGDVVVGLLSPRSFFARISYARPREIGNRLLVR